jgi:hypothetical protein
MYWFQADFVGSGKWFRRNRFPLGAVLMEIGILLGEQVRRLELRFCVFCYCPKAHNHCRMTASARPQAGAVSLILAAGN